MRIFRTGALLYELPARQWIDAFDDRDRAMSHLADQINARFGGLAAPRIIELADRLTPPR